jgi:hypothetical protein
MNNETDVEDNRTKTSITKFCTIHKDNIATYSFFSAIIITGLTLLAKLYIYVYYSGYYAYFNIDRSYIDINNQNIFYDLFFYSACLIMFAAISLLPYIIFISKLKKHKKVILTFLLLITTIFILYIYIYFTSGLYGKNIVPPSRQEILSLIWVTCWFLFIFYMFGIFSIVGFLINKISDNFQKKEKKDKEYKPFDKTQRTKVSIVVIIITFLTYIFVSYWMGYSTASDKKSFKTIDNSHIIIYEDTTQYIISDYKVIRNNSIEINSLKQKLIEKVDIETEKASYEYVKVNN